MKATLVTAAIAALAAAPLAAHPGPEPHARHAASAEAATHAEAHVTAGSGADVAAASDITVMGSLLPPARNNDFNKFWLDYRTDVSEAKRELASDLDRATDEEDVREAWAEYYREIRDAQKDYTKEMSERGYRVVSFEAEAESMLALRR